MKTSILTAIFSCVLAVEAGAATFDVIGLNDSNDRARVTFDYVSQTIGGQAMWGAKISVQNTSVNYSPTISGFAFNTPSQVTGLLGTFSSLLWTGQYQPNKANTPEKLGLFDVCMESNSGSPTNCNGGGSSWNRIDKGETGEFFVAFRGNNLHLLTTQSFLGLTSIAEPGGSTSTSFAVRFQDTGRYGTGSDVGAYAVPEPRSIMVLTSMMAGIGFVVARSRGKLRKSC